MAIRVIRTEEDPVLRKVSKPVKEVTPKIITLIDDMLDTMYEAMGVGLAAPQVTYLVHELAERGLPVDTQATTAREAAQTILSALREKNVI